MKNTHTHTCDVLLSPLSFVPSFFKTKQTNNTIYVVCGILHHKRLLAGPRGSLLGASIGVIWGIAEWEYVNAKENYRRERIKDFYPEVIRSRGKEEN